MPIIVKVFRDPVHNYIHIEDKTIYDLINTKEFQRLRRIKQLGTSSFVFHGAEHSRFTHCLGVYNIAKIITDNFSARYTKTWNPNENLVTQCAALLHDVGHGAYSHSFEHLFDTDHEAVTVAIITSPETEINAVLRKVSPDFPEKVASVITHEYSNPQVVQLISSQIDADRMDYLLRDAYYTGAGYGQFDLTRILHSITPLPHGIGFNFKSMHAVEDYVLSRYQMYQQVYFHPASRGTEVLLQNLLKRAKVLFAENSEYFYLSSPRLLPFFEGNFNLTDYLALDDGVMNTYFQAWTNHNDPILSDLASSYLSRRLPKSIKFDPNDKGQLRFLEQLISDAGYDIDYYTAINNSFDLPYDFYRPSSKSPRTQIEIIQKDLSLTELSKLSTIVASLAGTNHGNSRFYFPKPMLENDEFRKYIKNDEFTPF